MIKLKKPFLWDGHLVAEGKEIAVPNELEKRLIAAGNGEYVNSEKDVIPVSTPLIDRADLLAKAEALQLRLSDDLTDEQVKEAVEKAEKEQESDSPEDQCIVDPELNLGRTGSPQ